MQGHETLVGVERVYHLTLSLLREHTAVQPPSSALLLLTPNLSAASEE